MSAWVCPACGRQFGRRNQSHVCAPAIAVEDYLSVLPADWRDIFEAVIAYMTTLDGVHVEAVSVGILFKRSRTFAELRPMKSRVRLSLLLSHPIEDERVFQPRRVAGRRVPNFVDLYSPRDLDDHLRAWLAESFLDSPLERL